MPDTPTRFGPGPEERKLRNRLHFWLFRQWPQAVVRERLADADARAAL